MTDDWFISLPSLSATVTPYWMGSPLPHEAVGSLWWEVYKSGVDSDLVGRVIEWTVRGHLELILTQSVIPQISKGSGLRWTLFSPETKSWWCIFYLASELSLSVMNRAKMKAENGDTGCLRIHTSVITKILFYYLPDLFFLRVRERKRQWERENRGSINTTYIEY